MKIIVHHQPVNSELSCDMRVWQAAWDGNSVWDSQGTLKGGIFDFHLPDVSDPRKLQFKYCSTDLTGQSVWEMDDFIRRVFLTNPAEIWTFDLSGRVLYQPPFPAGAVFNSGDVLTFKVITQNLFRGGQIYAWNPYDSSNPSAYFPETARDETTSVSTFTVTLASWMTAGFHLKLMHPGPNGVSETWEPDSSNRVWRPCDGNSLWMKSGQNDLRSQPLSLTTLTLEVLFPTTLPNPPALVLQDVVENLSLQLTSSAVRAFAGSSLFQIAIYSARIYLGASYHLFTQNGYESSPIIRPFPANPADLTAISQFVLGADTWVDVFPTIVPATLSIQPLQETCLAAGVSVQIAIGNALSAYQTVPASRQADGTFSSQLAVAQNTITSVQLLPVGSTELKPYTWIDSRRFFTPTALTTTFYTTEGVYGISAYCKTLFADPPNRKALMEAAFGSAIVATGIFAAREMPHGVTLLNADTYFVVHAPHAVCADLILIDESAPGGPARQKFPMTLTNDMFYWWCKISKKMAVPGSRYHFLLNSDLEVIDPAAREVQDRGDFSTAFGDDPKDLRTSWSMVLDVADVMATAHVQSWQTLCWETFLVYEVHAKRFTDLQIGMLTPIDLLTDEMKPMSRRDQIGYLFQLPVTVFELMPVSEFSSTVSWGYDPAYYFAIDQFYGGAPALARFVNAAHKNQRGVMLDLVYNHSLGSSLMRIAPDVYRNGDYYGDRMNCGHPMVGEFLRQATVYLWRTFGLDGFRFDDTKTIVACEGGREFLGMIRSSIRAAASAEGQNWPYCVAENSDNGWDISDPSRGVMDGQWDIAEVYRIKDASYDSQHPDWDHSGPLQTEMNNPQYWGRPFFQATRFGESHDIVSAQGAGDLRIAARPPFGQGLQMAKALGAVTLLSNGVPMLFMGQEVGTTQSFSFNNNGLAVNPQNYDLSLANATDNTRVLAWFRALMGLRNDSTQGLRGETNYQVVQTGNRTVAFTCGVGQSLFAVVTFGTANNKQDSSWLGLPGGIAYKEIFNSSWPVFQVEFEQEQSNGGYTAQIYSSKILNLPSIGAVVLQRI